MEIVIDIDLKKCLSIRKETTDNGINYVIMTRAEWDSYRVCAIRDMDLLAKNYENISFNKNLRKQPEIDVGDFRISPQVFKEDGLSEIIELYEIKRREIVLEENNRIALEALEIINKGYDELLNQQHDEEKVALMKMTKDRLDSLVNKKLTTYEV